jgi:hypothetical protein
MAEPPSAPEAHVRAGRDGSSPPRMPRWVLWPAVVIGVLVLTFLVLRLFGVQHGPGRHMPGGGNPSATVAPGGHAPTGNHG